MSRRSVAYPTPLPSQIPYNAGVKIKSIQSGSTAISSTQRDVTITAVDPDKSIVLVTADGLVSLNALPVAFLHNSTTLRFECYNTGATAGWFVVEFDGPIVVQSGTVAWKSATSQNVNITAVDTDKAFLLINWATNTVGQGYSPRGAITSTTQLTFTRGQVGTGFTKVAWTVVEVG